MLTDILEWIGATWRHRIMKWLGVYDAMHDENWMSGFCC